MLDEVFDPFSLYNYCSPVEGEHFFAGVAQLVEQLIRNQQVSGSSPLAGFSRDKTNTYTLTSSVLVSIFTRFISVARDCSGWYVPVGRRADGYVKAAKCTFGIK